MLVLRFGSGKLNKNKNHLGFVAISRSFHAYPRINHLIVNGRRRVARRRKKKKKYSSIGFHVF